MPDLNEFEKWQMARCLAATSEERWAMNKARIRALGFYELTAKEKLRVMKDFVGIVE